MRILNFGSLNIDYVYRVNEIVRPGETISASVRDRFCGGKGLNQSTALARAGAKVCHAGMTGHDGVFMIDALKDSGVDTRYIVMSESESGHAVIQVDKEGQNSIIIYPGANRQITEQMIDRVLEGFEEDDWVLLQNEINNTGYIIDKAYEKGLKIAFNPSPIDDSINGLPLEKVSLFFLNEIEGEAITGKNKSDDICDELLSRYEEAEAVLTLGSHGAVFASAGIRLFQEAIPVKAVDTTAAGDTFTGYFLHSYASGQTPEHSLLRAAAAAAVTVSRKGAMPSIPYDRDVTNMMQKGV